MTPILQLLARMPPQSRTKTAIYKRAEVLGVDVPADPLATLLTEALKAQPHAKHREYAVGDDRHTRVLNTPRHHATMIAASLLEFVPGDLPMTVKLLDGVEEYQLAQAAKPGDQEEYLRSQLYLGVLDNHVVVVQSPSLSSGHLEKYLSWFLTDCTGVLQSGAQVILHDRVKLPEGAEPKKLERVRGVRLSTHITPQQMATGAAERVPESRAQEAPRPGALLRRMMTSMVPEGLQDVLTGLASAEGLAVEELELSFEIRRRGRFPTEANRSIIDEIADLTRNAEDIDFELEVPGLGTIRRGDLQLKKPISVRHSNGTLHFEELVPKLHDWVVGLINRGEIPAPRAGA